LHIQSDPRPLHMASMLLIFSLLICSALSTNPVDRAELVALGADLCSSTAIVFSNDSRYATAKLATIKTVFFAPFAIIYATCENDVVEFINFVNAVEDEVPFRIRSGGHQWGGYSNCDDCIVLDLSHLNSTSFDASTGMVTLGPGVNNGQLVPFLAANDVMLPHGWCPTVCIGGLAQNGGTSFLNRPLGMISDYVQSVNIVTADGEKLTCSVDPSVEDQSQSENGCSDLLWAVRGSGGGQWGVVTSYTLRTTPMVVQGEVYHFYVSIPYDINNSTSLRVFLDWLNTEMADNALDDRVGIAGFIGCDFSNGVSFNMHLNGWWWGEDADEGRTYITGVLDAAFGGLDGYYLGGLENMTYVELFETLTGAYAYGPPQVTSSRLIFDEFNFGDEYVDALIALLNNEVNNAQSVSNQGGFIDITVLFEIFNEKVNNAALTYNTSLPNRAMKGYTVIQAFVSSLDEAVVQNGWDWAQTANDNVNSLVSNQTYVGYKDRMQTDWKENYFGRETALYDKLMAIKEKYDPNNVFYDGVAFFVDSEAVSTTADPDDSSAPRPEMKRLLFALYYVFFLALSFL